MRVAIVVAAAVLCTATGTGAAGRASTPATGVPEAEAVRIDGELNDAVWATAPPITGFVQREPRDGAPATFETIARIAYDATALYVAVHAIDPEPDRIEGIRTRRDENSPSDWIGVIIDSFHDRRSAFEFAVNPAGVKRDAYWFNDTSSDPGWDAVWDVAVSRGARGWRAEFRIPFSQLRFTPSPSATFGLAIVRRIARLDELSTWPLLSKNESGYVSRFGTLTGLQLERPPRRLELSPYVVGQLTTQPAALGNPLVSGRETGRAAGLDLKYALRPGLTLTATANPDFGQVEADPAVVNLSAFETFFGERRPFFVEGSGIFRFDVDCNDGTCSGLFYSRRIGRAPRGIAAVPEGGFASTPTQTTIAGAAKLTGRLAGFAIGALNAVTTREDALIATGAAQARQAVEPPTSYTVARARRDFGDQSSLGFIATSTNRRLDADTRFLPRAAYTGGADWDWRLGGRYSLTGFLAMSHVAGDAAAIDLLQRSNVHALHRPDAHTLDYDPTRTSLGGYAARVGINRIAGERVRFSSHWGVKSPGFDINDVGFLQRADQRTMSNWAQWRHDRPSKYLRSFRINLNQWAGWNADGDRLFSGGNVNMHWVLANSWSTGFGVNLNAQGFNDRATRGGPGAYGNGARNLWTYVNSDGRKPVSVSVMAFGSGDGRGTTMADVSPSVSWRPTTYLRVSAGTSISRNRNASQWIGRHGGAYVFGRLDQTTVALTARVNYTVTPALSIQVYAQPFVSAGDYSGFKVLADGRSKDYATRYAPYDYPGNPDFNYRSFRTTNVLRWEYRPGSALFVVWQQGREERAEHGTFDAGRDFGRAFAAPGRDVFLVKWSYWFNM
jgi:hypothetical protein